MNTSSPLTLAILLVFLVVQVSIQIMLMYGFYDASRLSEKLSMKASYKEPINVSCFYAASLISDKPAINVICAFGALLLLALLLKQDTEGALLCVCPLMELLAPVGDSTESSHRPKATATEALKRVMLALGRYSLFAFLQLMWCLRTFMLPVLGGLGTAHAFVGSDHAADIVLNSVAIGFVYDLDEFLFYTLLSKSRREEWELRPPASTSPLYTARGRKIVGWYSWAAFVIDYSIVSWYSLVYLEAFGDFYEEWEFHSFEVLRPYVMIRATAIAACQAHLYLASGRNTSPIRLMLGALGIALVIVALGVFTLTVLVSGGLEFGLGASFHPVEADAGLNECISDASVDTVEMNGVIHACVEVHEASDILSQLQAAREAHYGGVAHFMASVWGSRL